MIRPRRQATRRAAVLVLGFLALGALFGLDAIYVMHYAAEAACEGVDSGDPYDCFICASLFTMGLDLPSVAIVPPPTPGPLSESAPVAAAARRECVRRVGARSPPGRLV